MLRADHRSRGALPNLVRCCVLSRNLVNEEVLAHWTVRGGADGSKTKFSTLNISRSDDSSIEGTMSMEMELMTFRWQGPFG